MTVVLPFYIALLLGGVLSRVGGLFLTRLTWRPDVERFGRRSPMLQIALHPERYATPKRLGAIRFLNLVGASLVAGAAALMSYAIALRRV